MLHVITEVGKPGRCEREKRHFPHIHNRGDVSKDPLPRARRYIPHSYGTFDEWRPHPQSIQPEYTEAGPDWKSRIRYLPDPEDPKYPAMEIFENNWKAMRPYPYTYMRTSTEWLLDPGLSSKGMKCVFNGQHSATRTSSNELTHQLRFGRGRNEGYIDKRNGIPESSPGDKLYRTPEYASGFHKLGSSLPIIDFGANSPWRKNVPDTFVPLQSLPDPPREPFKVRARREERENERKVVKALDTWRPATPLKPEKMDEKK